MHLTNKEADMTALDTLNFVAFNPLQNNNYREEIIKTSFENLGISFDNICHIDSNKHIKSLNSPIGFSDDVHFKDKRGYSFHQKSFLIK